MLLDTLSQRRDATTIEMTLHSSVSKCQSHIDVQKRIRVRHYLYQVTVALIFERIDSQSDLMMRKSYIYISATIFRNI